MNEEKYSEEITILDEIEPSPSSLIGEEDDDEKSRFTTTFPIGLNGNDRGRNLVKYLTRIQKYSSITFTVFTSIHLVNTSIIPLFTGSIPFSDSNLLLTRPYYQSFPLELIMVVIPITFHVTAGLALRIHKRNATIQRYGVSQVPISTRLQKRLKIWPHLSWISVSGYLLIPLVFGHAFLNRILPWVYEGGNSSIGLGYVAHVFARYPKLATASYMTLIATAAGHFVWGIARWAGLSSIRKNYDTEWEWHRGRRRRWYAINGVAGILLSTWMIGGIGVVARGGRSDGWIGKAYDKLLEQINL